MPSHNLKRAGSNRPGITPRLESCVPLGSWLRLGACGEPLAGKKRRGIPGVEVIHRDWHSLFGGYAEEEIVPHQNKLRSSLGGMARFVRASVGIEPSVESEGGTRAIV